MRDRTGQMVLAGTKELHILPDVQTTFQLFAAHLRRVETPWSYPTHAHAMYELNVVTAGVQRFTVESRVFAQRPGDIVLVRPGERHSSVADGGAGGSDRSGDGSGDEANSGSEMAYFCFHFQADDPLLRRVLYTLDNVLYRQGSPLERRIGPAVKRLMDLATGTDDADSAAVRMKTLSAVYELLAALAEGSSSETEQAAKQSPPQSTRLAETIAGRIDHSVLAGDDDGGDDDATIEGIATALGYSAAHCGRIFRDVYGMSPRAYRSAVVLREAKLMLLGGELSVEAIAARLGYDDAATFSKQFRRWTGMSPREYRTM
ncbi:AraC family transcriptional regulator [Paenibacillus sp. TRM 82003]|nr:AraC family transcriptional regulator [Paenibacillus sp. TRM 82003]